MLAVLFSKVPNPSYCLNYLLLELNYGGEKYQLRQCVKYVLPFVRTAQYRNFFKVYAPDILNRSTQANAYISSWSYLCASQKH